MPRRSNLSWVVLLLVSLQLGLLWVQGAQLHQQNLLLRELRADIQDLTDSLDAGQDSPAPQEDSDVVPLRHRGPLRSRIQRTAVLGLQEEQDSAAEELQAAKESQQKAVEEARAAQSKLSIQENARKAEEARKIQAATDTWQRWSLAALGLLCLAWIVRVLLRRR